MIPVESQDVPTVVCGTADARTTYYQAIATIKLS
jgi:hypothetical protein